MTAPGARTILIVDDEHAIVEAVSELLAWEGYAVRTAANGHGALDALRDGRVDVVLLDLMMPGMDGLQLAARIRGDGALRRVPLVLMTAAAPPPVDPDTWAAVLRKPFDLPALRGAIARALGVSPGAGRP